MGKNGSVRKTFVAGVDKEYNDKILYHYHPEMKEINEFMESKGFTMIEYSFSDNNPTELRYIEKTPIIIKGDGNGEE